MKKVVSKFWNLFPWIWMALGTLCNIWYQIVPGKWILDSDLASDMVLADHLNKVHRLISKDWIYSTELKVFESQQFYQIGLLVFPDNWHMARVLAAILMYIVFIALLWLLAKNMGLGEYAPWLSAVLMWPFGKTYLIYAMYGTYYLVYMYFSIAVSIVLFRLFQLQQKDTAGKHKEILILYGIGIACSFASGLNGVKQMMIYFAPLLLAAFGTLFLEAYRKKAETLAEIRDKCKPVWMLTSNSLSFVVANALGCLINMKGLSRVYHFEQYSNIVFLDGRENRLYDILLDFVKLFGYAEDVEVFSVAGIAGALGLVFAAIFLICLIRLNIRLGKLSILEQNTVLLVDITLIFEAAVYCFMGNYKNYFWLPLLPYAVSLILLELKTEFVPMKFFKKTVLTGIALMLPILSAGAMKQEITNPQLTTGGFAEAVEYLVDSDLTEGYATFWNSAVLEEMSSGKIQTWMLYNVHDSFLKYGWQQEIYKMSTDPEGRCFLLVNEDVDGEVAYSALVQYGSGELVYHSDPIYIYEFESPSRIQDAVDEYIKTLQ